MRKRLLSTLLTLCLLLALLPAVSIPASAATVDYFLHLDDTDGKLHKNSSAGEVVTPAGAVVTGSKGNRILTLTNFTFETTANVALFLSNTPTTIVLVGNNTITSTDTTGTLGSHGIGGISSITITSSTGGTLTAIGGNPPGNFSAGIYTTSAITINGNAVVTAMGGNSPFSYGIYATKGLTIGGSAVVTAAGGPRDNNSIGIGSSGSTAVPLAINGGMLTAIGNDRAFNFKYTVPSGYSYYVNTTTAPSTVPLTGNGTTTLIGTTLKYARIVSDNVNSYKVTVSDGTGGNWYYAGDAIHATANPAPEGKQFDKWITSGIILDSPNSESVSFIMPAKDVVLKATYTEIVPDASDSAITPTAASFVKNTDGDVAITMDLAGNTLQNIENGYYTLKSGTDYTTSGNTVTLKKAYINTLTAGNYLFTFVFSSGSSPILTLTVLDGEDAGGAMSNFSKSRSYTKGQFGDVNEAMWYGFDEQKVIANAYEYGLMQGSDNTFNPVGNMTIAEAVTIAARVHHIYGGGDGVFTQGSVWYQVYVDYAIANDIIGVGTFSNYNKAATRAEMAYIFSRALPDTEFASQNTVNSLPDVSSITPYYSSILMLYKAGVLGGSDTAGTFNPADNIIRAEAAAIISRVILPASRFNGKTFG